MSDEKKIEFLNDVVRSIDLIYDQLSTMQREALDQALTLVPKDRCLLLRQVIHRRRPFFSLDNQIVKKEEKLR